MVVNSIGIGNVNIRQAVSIIIISAKNSPLVDKMPPLSVSGSDQLAFPSLERHRKTNENLLFEMKIVKYVVEIKKGLPNSVSY